MAQDFSTTLCGVGDCGSCIYSWFCTPCALAQARSNLDDSSCCFNFFCVGPVAARWMIRTAYGIPGDGCNDCMTAIFCPCCSVNQLYQTTKTKKNPTSDGGRSFNTNPFESKLGSGDCGAGCYACCCMPCFVGTTLERSVGMPFCMGCMCTNLCVARNMIRYHYRIKGSDMQEECLTPCVVYVLGSFVAQFVPCIWCCLLPAIVSFGVQLSSETDKKSSNANRQYFIGYSPPPAAGQSSHPHGAMQQSGSPQYGTPQQPYNPGYPQQQFNNSGYAGPQPHMQQQQPYMQQQQPYMQQQQQQYGQQPYGQQQYGVPPGQHGAMLSYSNPGQVYPQPQYQQPPDVVYVQATVIPEQQMSNVPPPQYGAPDGIDKKPRG